MLSLRSSFLIITRFYTSSTSTSASAANKSSGFKRISRESFSFRSELQLDELPFIFWTTPSSKVELTILNVKVQHYSVLISSLFKISISRSCFEGFAEQMPGSIIFAIKNDGCSGHLNFWFRIVNMCKTLSQIKRLGKYFQRWSERKDFAQVSTRPRNWERKIEKYWKHFENSLNKASPSAGGGVRAKPEKNLPARSICHQRFENLELGLVFHFYLL